MDDFTDTLLQWFERDRARLVSLACSLVRARSPNPPGNTGEVASCITRFLDSEDLAYDVIAPRAERPNIVASFAGNGLGKSLVLNGHMDVLPVDESERWTCGPWSGTVEDGKIWGRGATNMKCGLAAALVVYSYLHKMRKRLDGSLTLGIVSDEIVLGDHGTRHLMKCTPGILGDACLIAEPSGLTTFRFAEKGPMRLRFRIETASAHGAFTHLGEGAARMASRLIADLDELTLIEPEIPTRIAAAIRESAVATDETQGEGAIEIIPRVTVAITGIHGGVAMNMIPARCEFVADIRLPIGVEKTDVIERIMAILARHPNASFEEIGFQPPAWSDPHGHLPGLIRANVKRLRRTEPVPAISLGCTDARLWRYRGIPCYTYGPPPRGMGGVDEHVDIEDLMHVARTHALTAHDYLSGS